MKVLLTGGSGQLGSYLLEDLSRDHQVISVDLVAPRIREHVPFHRDGDIRDTVSMREACRDADAIVHLAAQVSVVRSTEDPAWDLDVNVGGTLSMLKAANDEGVPSFIHISTAAVYGDPVYLPVDESHPTRPRSFYGTSKLSAEHYVRAFKESFDQDYIIIRPFNLYSPRADPKSPYSGVITRFVENAMNGMPLTIEGDGEQTRDFIHAKDVASMICSCLTSNIRNVTMNCGSGQSTTINALAETVISVAPRPVEIVHGPPRVGDIRHSLGDASVSEKLLGFKPKISLRDGLAAFFDS
ncbi:MAG: NAD-dependent epimerase/dehydratase family protein [Methanomassiliicoccales archaeon]|nr:NAD-dependent epimerase/dehydratase family protein [Methanomassiliicoccales archaeon]NYT15561.1 NAD-dependent epimerase/dehydratase family protein [Methanomassiliicoccales archaeon]